MSLSVNDKLFIAKTIADPDEYVVFTTDTIRVVATKDEAFEYAKSVKELNPSVYFILKDGSSTFYFF